MIWQGRSFRLSLDRYSGAPVETRADAEAQADQRRARIRSGTFDKTPETAGETAARDGTLAFLAFAAQWSSRRGYQLGRARTNDYRLKLVHDFALPGRSLAVTFGEKRAVDITTK